MIKDMEQNIKLSYSVPVVVTDGHIVMVSDAGVPTLLFFQGRNQVGNEVQADVVAGVRLSSLEDLENLKKAIDETVKKHQEREP